MLPVQLHKLHEQCAEQPELYRIAGDIFAEAKAAASRAKLREDEERSQTVLAVRAAPQSYGLDKMTEAAIEAVVNNQDEVRAAARESIDAQRECDLLRSLLAAYDQRRSMLDTEARLYTANYWGSEGAAFGSLSATEKAIADKRRGG